MAMSFGEQDKSVLGDLEKTMREGAEAIDCDAVIEEALGPPRPVTSRRVSPSEHLPAYKLARGDAAALGQFYLAISHGQYREPEFIDFVEAMEHLMERDNG